MTTTITTTKTTSHKRKSIMGCRECSGHGKDGYVSVNVEGVKTVHEKLGPDQFAVFSPLHSDDIALTGYNTCYLDYAELDEDDYSITMCLRSTCDTCDTYTTPVRKTAYISDLSVLDAFPEAKKAVTEDIDELKSDVARLKEINDEVDGECELDRQSNGVEVTLCDYLLTDKTYVVVTLSDAGNVLSIERKTL